MCKMDNHQGLLYRTGDAAQRCVAAWRGEEFGGECVCAKLLQSWLTLCDPVNHSLPGSFVCGIFPGKNTGVGGHALLQGSFLTQGSNPHLLCLLLWQVGSSPLAPPGKPLQENGYMYMCG